MPLGDSELASSAGVARKLVRRIPSYLFFLIGVLAIVGSLAISSSVYDRFSRSHFNVNAVSQGFSSRQYRPCLVQLFGSAELYKGTSLPAASARLSVQLARRLAKKHGMEHHLYDCGGFGYCSKPPAVADACFSQRCSHVLYLDADVFMHDDRLEVVDHLRKSYPDAVLLSGIDYYRTMMSERWHNGSARMYRTDSNSGMVQFKCDHRLSRRVLYEWERLCVSFSPTQDDQEAFTLLETLPQYKKLGLFARDALILGQYSVVARHFPGDKGKFSQYPLKTMADYETRKAKLQNSGQFKWLHKYWTKTRGMEIPETERWRIGKNSNAGWKWNGTAFKKCPLEKENSFVDRILNAN